MRKLIVVICAALWVFSGSSRATEPPPATGFSGTFKDDRLTVSLKVDGNHLSGTMILGDQTFPT